MLMFLGNAGPSKAEVLLVSLASPLEGVNATEFERSSGQLQSVLAAIYMPTYFCVHRVRQVATRLQKTPHGHIFLPCNVAHILKEACPGE